MIKKSLSVVTKNTSVVSHVDGVDGLISAWRDYQNTKEVETTRRAKIAADRDVQLESIRAQSLALHSLIEGTFKERAGKFDKYFDLLNEGLVNGNDQAVNCALTLIVEQTKISPMASAAQLMREISDPNVKAIEI